MVAQRLQQISYVYGIQLLPYYDMKLPDGFAYIVASTVTGPQIDNTLRSAVHIMLA